jgi:M6 family metalloprotease-like protein
MGYTIRSGRSMLVLLLGLLAVSALGMPPRPGVKLSQSQVDEQARLGVNIALRPVRDAGLAGLRNTPGDVTPLVTGTKMFVVAAINFSDYANAYTTASFDSMLFGTWFSGSAKSYYQQVSYGEFNMTGAISGWYTASQNHAYYGNSQGSARAAALVKEAATAADASVNYADFDNDGDGYVDVFTCIHAGYGAEESGSGSDIWSHQWSFSSAGIGEYTSNDPWPGHSGQYIKVDDYTVDPERSGYTNRGTMACIGVFCHEWGHALGLPDLYDTDGGGEGLGNWSLMAAGSWGGDGNSPYYPAHLDAWAKMQLGWWNPRAVRMPASYSIPQVETNSNGYWLMGRNRTFKEYLLVENRRKVGFDTTLLNSGLLIYHVDESVIARRLSNNQVNAGGSGWKYGVELEQADGVDHLYNGNNRGDANDPWPGGLGRTVFDSATTPDTRTNYPTSSPLYTGSYARGIPASAPTMACTLSSGFTGQFTGGPDAGNYSWVDSDTAGGPAYGWNDISTGGTLLGYGDEARWSVTLPFSFNLYGSNYSTIWVSTNGWLSFGSDPGTNDSTNRAIPTASAPNAAAFVYWENLDNVASDSGGIYYRNYGTTPNCSTVVMWKNARRKGLNGGSLKPINPVSFEVVLYQQNNRVVMRYRDCAVGDTLFSWGRGASVGIENSTGSVGLQYLYNGAPAGNLLANERAIEFSYAAVPSRDVGVSRLMAPAGAIDSGVVVAPACSVYNYGTTTETYAVRMKVGSSYNQTMTVTSHAPGTYVPVSFPNWTALPRGTWAVTCSTELAGDAVHGNDRQSGTVTVNVRDAQAVSIIAPTGTVDSGASVTPQASVRNNGTAAATFNVQMTIAGGYSNTQTVTALASGASQTVTFVNWTPSQRGGPFAVRCTTMLASDMVGSNDLATGTVSVSVRDAQAVSIVAPTGSVDSGTVITPQASVRNNGTAAATFDVRMTIAGGYTNTQTVTALAAGATQTVSFSNWTASPPGGPYAVRCTTMLANDMVGSNNLATGQVSVSLIDAQALAILAPTGTVDSGAAIAPQATVRNNGTTAATFDVRMTIAGGYSNTQAVTALASGASQTVTFANWTPTQRGGPFAVRCTTMLASDMVAANNLVTGTVNVGVRDAQAVAVLAPTGAVDSGTIITPQATVKNNGTAAATFDVRMTIAGGYSNTQTVTALAAGAAQTVSFSNWTASPRGGPYAVRCTTMLANDMVGSNNLATGTVTVGVRDAQAVTILAPTGVVDSGTVVTPQATLKNDGTAAATFDVRLTIGAGYTNTQTVTALAAGATRTVSFSAWTASPRGGPYAVRCTTMLAGDMVPANDLATGDVTVDVRDAEAVAVIAPTGAVDSGAAITPQAMVRNNGAAAATFDVRMSIGAGYSNTQTVTALAAGATRTVNFSNWTALPRGGPFAVRCTTLLAGDLVPGNDVATAQVTVDVRDAQAVSIVAPTGAVDSGTVITPQATVKNDGTAAATFDVRMTIGTGYSNTQTVTALAAGATRTVSFSTWTASPRGGPYAVRCTTLLAGDMMPADDLATGDVSVTLVDAQAVAIVAPAGAVDSGTVMTPQATVRNGGTAAATFDVRMTIGAAYTNTQTVTALAAGATQTVNFTNWTAVQRGGPFAVRCTTMLAGDMVPANDLATGDVTVDVHDARAIAVIAPLGVVDSGTVITPQAAVRNDGTAAATFDVRMTIGAGYTNTQTVTALGVGATQTVNFIDWTASPRGGPFAVRCTTMLAGDMVAGNNLATTQVSVNVRDAEVVAVIAPSGSVDSGTVISPQATVRNNGTAAATFDVRMSIATGYTSTQTVAALAAGATRTVTFADWNAFQRGGPYAVRCTTMLANDMVPANDLATAQVVIAVRDVQALTIVAPVGTVDSGAPIVPKVAVRNNGSDPATFSVSMTIGAGYIDQQTVTNLASGATQTVNFASWSPDQRGGPFAVRCTTMLSGDLVTANDIALAAVDVIVRDAEAVAIIAPTGIVDSGSVAAPQATVRNNGTGAATFDVRMTIGTDYTDQQTVTDLASGATQAVAFGEWVAAERGGPFAVRCSTMLIGDIVAANDVASAEVTVNVSDVAAVAVITPTGAVDSGAVILPLATVLNEGSTPVTFDVWMTIAPGYADTQAVTGLAAGETLTVAFAEWTPRERGGPFAVRCSTMLSGDVANDNDLAVGEVMVNTRDVAATWIGAPVGQYSEGAVVTPRCSLYNFGSVTETYDVRFHIGSGYDQTLTATDHTPGTALYMTFPAWTAQPPGAFAVSCSTGLADDRVPGNNVIRTVVTVGGAAGWTERSPMPPGATGKAVRDGAWLAFDPDHGQIYSAKGNKSTDFFAYDPAADTWRTKAEYPGGLSGKAPYKGATACPDGAGRVFTTKGNNTLEFFLYGTAANAWSQLADVPIGGNKLKGGTDLAYVPGVDTDYVYLLKGYKNEFYRYCVASGRWEVMPSAPTSAGVRYDRGSFLVYDGAGTIYAHQAKYNKLYAFDVAARAWRVSPALEGMPFNSGITGQHKKKSRDGGCGVWSDGSIYALKGGNTQEFYRYLPSRDSWLELDTIPAWGHTQRKKKVRGGADIASIGDGLLFALKGNKTLEVWRYLDGGTVMAGRPERDGVTVSGGLTIDDCRLSIAPNPLSSGRVTVGWRLPDGVETMRMRLVFYDAAGRNILVVGLLPQKGGSKSVDLGGVPGGVYLVRLEAGATVLTSKLIITR